MLNKNIDFLEARNRNKADGDEVVFRHFIKSKKGYFIDLFFGVSALKYFSIILFAGLFFLFYYFLLRKDGKIDLEFLGFDLFFVGVGVLCYAIHLIIGIWQWKFVKHVVVTNEGIWVAFHSSFWWSVAYDGRKHFLSPYWSVYDWCELKELTLFSDRISRTFKLKNFRMHRWDGVQEVKFLAESDVDSLVQFARSNMKPKKKKKENVSKQHDFFEKVGKFVSGERDEES